MISKPRFFCGLNPLQKIINSVKVISFNTQRAMPSALIALHQNIYKWT